MTTPTWIEVDESRYDEMLGVLPPALMTAIGFLVGEPMDHRYCTVTKVVRPRYAAFVRYGERFFESAFAMTIPEFKAVTMTDVVGTEAELYASKERPPCNW